MGERRAGILLPLFALRGAADWGVGEIGDLPAFVAWLERAGHRDLYLLPILERPAGERSPYAALTAFALDPLYLSLRLCEDFDAAGGEGSLGAADRAIIDAARGGAGIDPERIRPIKMRALERAFGQFEATEAASGSCRARAFEAFLEAEQSWIEPYALFRVLRDVVAGAPWWTWPESLRVRVDGALREASGTHARRRRFYGWVQWSLYDQWNTMRRALGRVRVVGDLPFMVARDSADVWAEQGAFDVTASVGAPPDQFEADGQDWGLPPWRWDVIRAEAWRWHRRRVEHMAKAFDGCRVDHVVGYYRTWVRPGNGARPGFLPSDEAEQREQGCAVIDAIRDAASPMNIVAEDLGAIPDFVRASLHERGIPGYRIVRWECDDGAPRDPRSYPACSLATTGTHDTSTLAQWWSDELDDAGRHAYARLPGFAPRTMLPSALDDETLEWFLDGLYGAGSDVVVLPFQDAYGGRERTNIPATVGMHNWTYRCPWTVEELTGTIGGRLADRLARLAVRHGRTLG